MDVKVLDRWFEIFVSEFIGTGFLLYFSCLGLFTMAGEWKPLAPMQGGIVSGFVVSSIICAIGHLSKAHLNPAVSLCAYLLGHNSFLTTLVYVISEILGALLGMCLLRISVPDKLYGMYNANAGPCGFCATAVHPDLSLLQAFMIEFVCTSLLIFVVCSVWDPRNTKINDSIPIKFALTVAVIAISAGPFTGASMNPARSLAPAIVNNGWQNHWLYWVAPLSSSLITTSFYKCVFLRKLKTNGSKYSMNAEPSSAMLKTRISMNPNDEPVCQESNERL